MTVTVLCFYFGYFFRKRNNAIHRFSNLVGVTLNLCIAIFILIAKYLLGGVMSFDIYPNVDRLFIDIHRFFAAIALLMMLFMAYTGLSRKRHLHEKMHYVFLPLYTLVYLSGLFLFKSHPN